MIPTTLLLLDIQNDFFDGGAYALVGAPAATKKAGSLLQCFRDHSGHHIHTQHENRSNGSIFCVPGTDGIRIHDLVAHYEGEPIVYKKHPNAFFQTDLQSILISAKTRRLILCGMPFETTVLTTARSAHSLGYEVMIVEDACAAENPASTALNDLQKIYTILSTEQIIRTLSVERGF